MLLPWAHMFIQRGKGCEQTPPGQLGQGGQQGGGEGMQKEPGEGARACHQMGRTRPWTAAPGTPTPDVGAQVQRLPEAAISSGPRNPGCSQLRRPRPLCRRGS